MIDRFTDSLYWPALIGAWVSALVAGCAVLIGKPFGGLVEATTAVLGLLAAFLFVVMLLDGPTRRAVANYNASEQARAGRTSWRQRFFPSDTVDGRLLVVNRFAWLESLVVIISGRDDLILLVVASFMLSTLMIGLMMKRRAGEAAG